MRFALPLLALVVLLLLFSGCASQNGGASGNAPAQTTGYGGGNSGTTALPGVALAKETPAE